MNTINQYQIFSPIPFVAYHPDIIYTDDNKHIEVDINHNYGRYDEYNYNNIAFYVKDYIASMLYEISFSISLKINTIIICNVLLLCFSEKSC